MSAKYPPYVNAYGNIPKIFNKIKSAAVPSKFSYDFLKTVLGFKSSSAQAMVPLLKRLGFLDQGSSPTAAYKDYRKDSKSGLVMADRIREAYKDLYQTDEFAHKLPTKELKDNLATVLGVEKTDPNVSAAVATFSELVKLADFDKVEGGGGNVDEENIVEKKEADAKLPPSFLGTAQGGGVKFGLSYTINLNLPPTTDIQVFDAIFKSLKQNILD